MMARVKVTNPVTGVVVEVGSNSPLVTRWPLAEEPAEKKEPAKAKPRRSARKEK